MDERIGFGLKSCREQVKCWTCVCVLVAVGSGLGPGYGGVVCMYV